MATKTISLRPEAYERLRAARSRSDESFSQVVMRARWEPETLTGRELLELLAESGPLLSEDALDRIEAAKVADQPPANKWHEGRFSRPPS